MSVNKLFCNFHLLLNKISTNNVIIKRLLNNRNVELNLEYLCSPANKGSIAENILRRKGVGNIEQVHSLYEKLKLLNKNDQQYEQVQQEFLTEALKIPNDSHTAIVDYGNDPKPIKFVGDKPNFSYKPKEFHDLTKHLNIMRTSQLGNVAGTRSYYFFGALAELEQALIKYTLKRLRNNGYQLISVPDILPASVIESCGFPVKGERTQVYKLDNETDLYLSGTSEMAIAGFFKDKIIEEEKLPIKIAAVSRCYRAETSSTAEERGIYRVHQFTKVEMFALTHPNDSENTLESFRDLEEEHFSELGLHFKTLDMPPHELGAPAFRKYDIEAWLPGRNIFGEISSCSNCTDYQSRRLNIKFKSKDDTLRHVHTINGTACAVPRLLIALLETYQNEDGTVNVPEILLPYLRFNKIVREKHVPELKLKKYKRQN